MHRTIWYVVELSRPCSGDGTRGRNSDAIGAVKLTRTSVSIRGPHCRRRCHHLKFPSALQQQAFIRKGSVSLLLMARQLPLSAHIATAGAHESGLQEAQLVSKWIPAALRLPQTDDGTADRNHRRPALIEAEL